MLESSAPYAAPGIPPDEARRLRELAALDLLDTPPESVFDAITAAAARIFQVPIALLSLVDEDRQWFKSRFGLEATETPRAVSFCGHAILSPDELFVVPDSSKDDRFAANPLATDDPHVQFYAGVPVKGPAGSAIGTLCLIDHQPRQFSDEDAEVLRAMGRWVEIELVLRALGDKTAVLGHQGNAFEAIDRTRFWELSMDMFCIATAEGMFLDLNDRFTEVLGYSKEELLAEPFVNFIHPDDVAATTQEVERLAAGEPTIRFRNRYRAKDGSHHWLEWNARAVGSLLYATARDVTDQVTHDAIRQNLARQLHARNQELQEFTSIASHDLQEPLRKLMAFADRLQDRLGDQVDERSALYLERMQAAAERMRTFIRDLLTLSRIDTRQEPMVAVDLDALIQDAMEDLAEAIEENQATVSHGTLPAVKGDPLQLRQVFQNLLSNAIKYQPPGQQARIELDAEQRGGRVVVRVRDNGIGFDNEYADKIFRPFQRLHGTAEYQGTGMGLAIVKRVIDRHGGSITADGSDGALFEFDLEAA